MKPFFLSLLSLTLIFSLTGEAQNIYAPVEFHAEESAPVEKLVSLVRSHFPGARIYIAGGAARAFIDHALQGAPLRFRDLDLQVVASREPHEGESSSLLEEARQKTGLRPSVESHQTAQEIFLTDGHRSVDVSLYNGGEGFAGRGIFNIDTIRVQFPEQGGLDGLDGLVGAIRESGYSKAVHEGWIYDPAGAYPEYRRGELKARPEVVARLDSQTFAIRSVRTAGKLDLPKLPEFVARILAEKREKTFYRKNWNKHFLKILSDDRAAREVKWLSDLGTLSLWSPEVDRIVRKMSEAQIRALFASANGASAVPAADRYRKLTELAAADVQIQLMKDLERVNPDFAPFCSRVYN